MAKKERKTILTARQALIAAAVTGWSGDGFCSWSSPVERETLLAWGKSYQHDLPETALAQALNELATERLFYEIMYPIFEQPCYFCSYESNFLEELPEPIDDYINIDAGCRVSDLSELVDQWDEMREEIIEEWDFAWVFWGLCNGQGSQGPSGDRFAPCLGPSCCWFEDGKKGQCNWGLRFDRTRKATYSDMGILHRLHKREWKTEGDSIEFCQTALEQMGYKELADHIFGL